MKRLILINLGHLALAPLLAAGLIFCASSAMAQAPVIVNGADGSGSAAFWYLNGLPSCCADSPGTPPDQAIYYTQWNVVALPQPGCTGTPEWSTDSPTLVSISPDPPSMTLATLTSLGPSYTTKQSTPIYNIHIYVTACGVESAPFPVYINTPFSMSIAPQGQDCLGSVCNCGVLGLTNYVGYAGTTNNSGYDILGNTLVQIDLHEFLEGSQWSPGNNYSNYFTFPSSGGWPVSLWASKTTWTDDYIMCAAPPASNLSPPLLPWGSGNTPIFTITQLWFIGTQTIGPSGSCIGKDLVTYYNDHAAASGLQTPGIPATICNVSY
ncbi:MAG TPA: hypothetical protein VIN93_05580 [Bryobacteraceae bacterium]